MFMLSRSSNPNRYQLKCYMFSTYTRTHEILYTTDNIYEEDVVHLLQSSKVDDDDIQCALDITRLTNCTAVIGETGELEAIPVRSERSFEYEYKRGILPTKEYQDKTRPSSAAARSKRALN